MNLVASFANFGGFDIFILFLIVLVLFGAKKLPELARGMGQAIKEFNKAKDEFEREIHKPGEEVTVREAKDKQEHKPATSETAPAKSEAAPTTPNLPS